MRCSHVTIAACNRQLSAPSNLDRWAAVSRCALAVDDTPG